MNRERSGEEYCITSLQIAEQTGKRHPDVMRDIRVMLEQLSENANSHSQFEGIYQGERRTEKMYILPEREAMILASGYDVKLRAACIREF